MRDFFTIGEILALLSSSSSSAVAAAAAWDLPAEAAPADPAIATFDELVGGPLRRASAAAEKIGGKVLEATKILEEAFAAENHLDSTKDSVPELMRVCGETRVGIFALRDIQRGEEVTYDYKFVQFGADQNCYCGALSCQKKLGNKPSKLLSSHLPEESLLELVRVWQPRDKMYLAGYIYDFDSYSRKHTIMYVDRSSEIIDLSKEDWDILPL
uniref:Post-SET domain-containing protein n=1 Tax=Ananas comosus var. bracteatus TaxID=296719 RepID=A0A6V7NHX5_ANACO|nr:unnamed protein product [Ananas comosus var. bracteatus]